MSTPETINWMSSHGHRLLKKGYNIIPIQPASKIPGYNTGSQFIPLPKWNKITATEDDVSGWSNATGCGIGLLCNNVFAVDIDESDEALVSRLISLMREFLGYSPLYRVGNSPRCAFIYASQAVRSCKINDANVEILGTGQVVIYGTHPTGLPYTWPDDEPVRIPVRELPTPPEEQLHQFIQECKALKGQPPKPPGRGFTPAKTSPPPDTSEPKHPWLDFNDSDESRIASIRKAVLALPSSYYDDYNNWILIGLCLRSHEHIHADIKSLFHEFSAQSSKYNKEQTNNKWEGFDPASCSIGTIFYLAKQTQEGAVATARPSEDHKHHEPTEEAPEALTTAASGDVTADVTADAASPEFPAGLVGEVAKYICNTGIRAQPLLAIGAALCCVGVLGGGLYRTSSDLRTNIYVIAIGRSGSGKNAARNAIMRLFRRAGARQFLGGFKISSGAGLVSALQRKPYQLMLLDEFGDLLKRMSGRTPADNMRTLKEDILTIYSDAGNVHHGMEYSTRIIKDERKDVEEPCFCLYGLSNPTSFWKTLDSDNATNGLLPRFVIVDAGEKYPPARNITAEMLEPGQDLIRAIKDLKTRNEMHYDLSADEVNEHGEALTTRKPPVIVEFTPEAKTMVIQLLKASDRDLNNLPVESKCEAFLARRVELIIKVGLIISIGMINPPDDDKPPVISVATLTWSRDFIMASQKKTLQDVDIYATETKPEANLKKVLECIQKGGTQGVTRRQIARKMLKLSGYERDDAIRSLLEADMIISFSEKVNDSRKSTTFYKIRV